MATREERVVLSLEGNFTTEMAAATAATKVLRHELKELSGESARFSGSSERISRGIDKVGTSSEKSSRNLDNFSSSARRSGSEIDKLSGRVRILADAAAILGPSLVPIGAVGVAGISGLASQLGFAATGVGTLVLAFHGLGDVMKTVNKASLEPTVENISAAQIALSGLSPVTRDFVETLSAAQPELLKLQEVARAGIFPGFTEGLQSAASVLPKVTTLVGAMSTEIGDIGADIGASLESGRWDNFLDFLAVEGPSALGDMAEATGNTAHALANLWMATTPINNGFSDWLVNATKDFDNWSEGLSKTEGFHEFVSYIQETGPMVAETFGAIANAVLQIVEAAAPIGGPVLKGLEAMFDIIAKIADSDLGTPIFGALAALALLNRSMAITASLNRATFGGPAIAAIRGESGAVRGLAADFSLLNRARAGGAGALPAAGFIGPLTKQQSQTKAAEANFQRLGRTALKTGALLGGLAVASSGVADKFGVTNTISLGLAGSMAGPLGTAVGAGVGALIDMSHAADGLDQSLDNLNFAVKTGDVNGFTDALADAQKKLDDIKHTSGIGDFFSDGFKYVGDIIKHPLDYPLGPADRVQDTIDKAKASMEALQNPTQSVASLLAQNLGPAARAAAADVDGAAAALAGFNKNITAVNASLDKSDAIISYRDSLRDLVKVVKDNPGGIKFTSGTAAADAVQSQLNTVVRSALNAASKITDGAELNKFFRNARTSIINFARELHLPLDEVRDMLDAAGIAATHPIAPKVDPKPAKKGIDAVIKPLEKLLNTDWSVPVDANTDAALAKLKVLRGIITGLAKPVVVAPRPGQLFPDSPKNPPKKNPPPKKSGPSTRVSSSAPIAVFDANGRPVSGRAAGDPLGVVSFEDPVDTKPGAQTPGSYGTKKPKKAKEPKDSEFLSREEYRSAFQSLVGSLLSTMGIGPTGPAAEVHAAFKDFAAQLKQDGGKVGKNLDRFEKALVKSAVAIDKQRTKIDDLTKQLDALKQKAADLTGSVQAGFTTNVFDPNYDPFAESDAKYLKDNPGAQAPEHSALDRLTGSIQQVFTDIVDAAAFSSGIEDLKSKGFSGAGLEALSNSNNLDAVKTLNTLSPEVLAQYSRLFDQRAKTTLQAGQAVSNANFGEGIAKLDNQLSDANKHLASLEKAVKNILNAATQISLANHIGKAIAAAQKGQAYTANTKAGG